MNTIEVSLLDRRARSYSHKCSKYRADIEFEDDDDDDENDDLDEEDQIIGKVIISLEFASINVAFNEGPSSWPRYLEKSFESALKNEVKNVTISEKYYYGAWNRLLHTVFPPASRFEVLPQWPLPENSQQAVDFAVCIMMGSVVILILEIKPPTEIVFASKRIAADKQIRSRFLDIRTCGRIGTLPVVHAMSAFGTRVAFYTYHKKTRAVQPPPYTPGSADPVDVLIDSAPEEWWDTSVMEQDGADRFRAVIEDIKAMCRKERRRVKDE